MAADLVRWQVAGIAALGGPAAPAAKAATSDRIGLQSPLIAPCV